MRGRGRAQYRPCGLPGTAARGSVTLGGRRFRRGGRGCGPPTGPVSCTCRPMACFPSIEILGRMALEKMLTGLSPRRYGHGLEPAGQARPALVVPPVHHRAMGRAPPRGQTLIPRPHDRGRIRDLPDVLARPGAAGWRHEHNHCESSNQQPGQPHPLSRPVEDRMLAGVAAGGRDAADRRFPKKRDYI